MTRALLISVRFHEGRYHGSGDWPPSSARLFQALVAGAARSSLSQGDRFALLWLEKLNAPVITAPKETLGQPFSHYLPNNNDVTAKSGYLLRNAKGYRADKRYRPRIFDAAVPFLYAWTFQPSEETEAQAKAIARMAEQLYQLGRGVDMAWAVGEVIETDELDRRLEAFPGAIYRPCGGGDGGVLDCPEPGSLESLRERHEAGGQRFTRVGKGKQAKLLFSQAPRPRFRPVAYNSPATFLLFDLRNTAKTDAPLAPWPLAQIAELVQLLRGRVRENGTPESGAAERLWDKLPDKRGEVASVLIGRNATEADKRSRIRILPLPSIGHVHADRAIRRVAVEIPPNCPLRINDVAWAFSGMEVVPCTFDESTGEVLSRIQLVPAGDRSMLEHYGIDATHPSRVWRSITPLALPEGTKRRREEAKNDSERLTEQQLAAGAVLQALRHADVRASVGTVRMQREPFEARGARVEAFASGMRFVKQRLWHAEITFTTPVRGPLALGDGRYTGLGLMAPDQTAIDGVFSFSILGGLSDTAQPAELSRALRRAMMSRVQAQLEDRRRALPTFFTGHEAHGGTARRGSHAHLAFVADLQRQRLLIIAPHVFEHRAPQPDERGHLRVLDKAVAELNELRAGRSGLLRLGPGDARRCTAEPVLGSSHKWVSQTQFRPTRHAKRMTTTDALIADAQEELGRRGLPRPKQIQVLRCLEGNRGGYAGELAIQFSVAVTGPVLLGRDLHFGGGLFTAMS